MGLNYLIVGGTGSLGSEIVGLLRDRRGTASIAVMSRGEHKQQEMARRWPDVRCIIGDVRDLDSTANALHGIDAVINCAAMKHVDKVEIAQKEGLKINVLGAMNVADAAWDAGVQYCAFTSTDKAVLPITVYGAQKLLAERYYLEKNNTQDSTWFSVFKYGNVLASAGSVIPLFVKSLKERASVNVTDKRMTRFWVRLPDVARFIIENMDDKDKPEVQIPPMKAASVERVIAVLAKLLGLRAYTIAYTGLRCAEKIHEDIVSTHEVCWRSDNADQYTDEELSVLLAEFV